MEHVKVSVIIPIYNMEKWLEEAIESVARQTLKEIEIICIDDNSLDQSKKILEDWRKKDSRISFISNPKNRGVAKCRNDGISIARGEYVCFLDPDDYYPYSGILEVLYEKAVENNALICGGCFSDISPDGKVGVGEVFDNEHYFGYNFKNEGFVLYKDYQFDYGYHRFLYKREFLVENEISFPDLIRFQDPPFMVCAFIKAGKFYAVPMISYRYRYEHKKVNWTRDKINDFLTGAGYNLATAKEKGYEVLYELTLKRIFVEQRKPLLEHVLYEDVLKELGTILFGDGEIHGNGFRYYQELMGELGRFYLDERTDNSRLRDEIGSANEQKAHVLNELHRIRNSVSYKTGLAVTFLPRTVFHLLFRCKNGG